MALHSALIPGDGDDSLNYEPYLHQQLKKMLQQMRFSLEVLVLIYIYIHICQVFGFSAFQTD